MKKQKKLIVDWTDIVTLAGIIVTLIFITMLIIVAMGATWLEAFFHLKYVIPPLFVIIGSFLINYYFLIPRYSLGQKSIKKYLIACILLYILLSMGAGQLGHYIYPEPNFAGFPPMPVELGIASNLAFFLLNLLLIFTAFSVRYRQRNRHLELLQAEQEKERAQNELLRLKGQLNPHFLFNTLNNISSLAAFDPDATQVSISRLSDMLRYVLHDSSTNLVPLKKDMEFMQNYMDLMQIRYEDTLKLDVNIQVSNPDVQIPPMLFISLLENAYKYGASSLHPCKIQVQLHDDSSGSLHFFVENTLLTEQEMASKKKGGLGHVNLKKRLDLMFPEKYSFTYGETDGKYYKAEIHILCN